MEIKQQLIEAYNKDAKRRNVAEGKREQWKEEVRQKFAALLKKEDKRTLLELGAGAGFDSKFFQEEGYDVLATDLSPEMIHVCLNRGVPAQVVDIYDLSSLNRKFDAVFSMNVLLHVPKTDIDTVLASIAQTLATDGLFFYGVYGGEDKEEVFTDNTKMSLPRFFSFFSDQKLLEVVREKFDIVDFQPIDLEGSKQNLHFQALTLKKK